MDIYHLKVIAKTTTPLALDPFSGSALRGAFFHALWKRFCTNPEATACRACPFFEDCPVSSLVAPMREEVIEPQRHHVEDLPRPYCLIPPQLSMHRCDEETEKAETTVSSSQQILPQEKPGVRMLSLISRVLQPETRFTFDFRLIGMSIKLFPFVLRAFQEMEQYGLGRPLSTLQGQRGKFIIEEVQAYHPFTRQQQVLWKRDSIQPQRPTLCVTEDDVLQRGKTLSTHQVRLHFVTPTRLMTNREMTQKPVFYTLIRRTIQRLARLQQEYGKLAGTAFGDQYQDQGWHAQVNERAHAVRLIQDQTTWVQVSSYSGRQRRTMPIDGFIGSATFEGDLEGLQDLLAWGEVIQVGKSVTKGNGCYTIEV